MLNRHVTHLVVRYAHGQLRPAQRARVVNHARICAVCREALAREERLAADLHREMPLLGGVGAGQLSGLWAGVWHEVSAAHHRRQSTASLWLPGLSIVLAALLVLAVALPLVAQGGFRVQAAPLQPRPISTASPTPSVAETDEARLLASAIGPSGGNWAPQATVAYVSLAGASPAPMPEATVSPEALYFTYGR